MSCFSKVNNCWYCGYGSRQDNPLQVCCEFDCLLHLTCLREAIATLTVDDRETPIIAEEFRSRGLIT